MNSPWSLDSKQLFNKNLSFRLKSRLKTKKLIESQNVKKSIKIYKSNLDKDKNKFHQKESLLLFVLNLN